MSDKTRVEKIRELISWIEDLSIYLSIQDDEWLRSLSFEISGGPSDFPEYFDGVTHYYAEPRLVELQWTIKNLPVGWRESLGDT